ncbi:MULTISPECIES: glycosylase [Chitinophagaceae]
MIRCFFRIRLLLLGIVALLCSNVFGQDSVTNRELENVYQEVKTPFKYGLVMVPTDNSIKMDCPSIFRKGKKWYMVYIIYNGRGYETWLAKSKDLLHWETKGRIMSFSDTSDWDNNQKAAYIALQDPNWGGSYKWNKYQGKYWMSYFGGHARGYEAGMLSIGIAYTSRSPTKVHEWNRIANPVLKPNDPNVRWWENHTMYKSSIIPDSARLTGHPFVMYYNANGDSLDKKRGAERIGMAVSDDVVHWQRFGRDPVLNHNIGITGDAYLQKMGDLWVAFYFGAFWKNTSGAFNRFAVSKDLIHWKEYDKNLIEPSENYDEAFAHKSFVIKYKGVVYHFYCAVNKNQQRGIALATSVDKGKSQLSFLPYEKKKKK